MVTLRGVVWALVSVTSALAACAEGSEPTANNASDGAGATTSAGSNSGGAGAAGSGSGGAGTGVGGHAGDGGEAGAATTGGAGPGGEGGVGQGGGSAGQGGGGDPCAATSADDACDTCRKPACCAELTACSTDPLCVCWVDCIDLHTNDPNKTVICSGTCGAPMPSLGSINGVFNCQQACASCPPIPWG